MGNNNNSINFAYANRFRKDKFLLVLSPPVALLNMDKKDLSQRGTAYINSNSLQFTVKAVNLPEISIDHNPTRYAGQNISISSISRPYHGDLTIKFPVDNYWNNWWFVFTWLNLLNNSEESIVNANTSDPIMLLPQYQTTATLFALDEYDNPVIKFDFTSVFPIKLAEIQLDYADESEAECDATFAFSQYNVSLIDV